MPDKRIGSNELTVLHIGCRCYFKSVLALFLIPSVILPTHRSHQFDTFVSSVLRTENRIRAFRLFGFFHLHTRTVEQVLQPVLASIMQRSSRLPAGLHAARFTGNLSLRLLWHGGFWRCKWTAGIAKCDHQQRFQYHWCPWQEVKLLESKGHQWSPDNMIYRGSDPEPCEGWE